MPPDPDLTLAEPRNAGFSSLAETQSTTLRCPHRGRVGDATDFIIFIVRDPQPGPRTCPSSATEQRAQLQLQAAFPGSRCPVHVGLACWPCAVSAGRACLHLLPEEPNKAITVEKCPAGPISRVNSNRCWPRISVIPSESWYLHRRRSLTSQSRGH